MSKIFLNIFLSIIFLTSFFHLHTAIASESSPSATPSTSIKNKLEELEKDIASKAAKFKKEISKKLNNKAYVGTIKNKSQAAFTLATDAGPKIININEDTKYFSKLKGVRNISIKTLKEEDYIAALGDIDDTDVLTAKNVVLYEQPKPKKDFLWGQIISISDNLLTLRNNEEKNIAVSVKSDADFKLNNFVILTGNYNKNNIFDANFLYVIHTKGILKPNREASSSSRSANMPDN